MARVNRATDSVRAAITLIPSIRQHSTVIDPDANAKATTAIPSSGSRSFLQELSIGQAQNKSIAPLSARSYKDSDLEANCASVPNFNSNQHSHSNPEPKSINAKHSSRGLRRRAPIDSATFEPLDAVLEESAIAPTAPSFASVASTAVTLAASLKPPYHHSSQANASEIHPLLAAGPECPKRQQIERHLAATPLEGDAYSFPDMHIPQALGDQGDMSLDQDQPPAYDFHPATPLKVPEVEIEEVAEQAVSPSLTLISDRSSSYAGGSSRAGSFSVPRIEDSLEELDKLEEELEAINAVTQPRRINPDEVKASPKHLDPRSEAKKAIISKRASMGSLSATARIKQSERAQPSVRRSTSLVFRNKKEETPEPPRLRSQLSRSKLANTQAAPPKPPVKSTKPPTVPNFELPGEAVARRLREQREARLAQQAEAQKAYVAPPRPKSNKPLTKPNFELPGEAISRRKREEREARLKAQEEEEKKKREFKARPMRSSVAPSTLPRETITSRARQGKPPQGDDAKNSSDPTKSKRISLGVLRPTRGETVDSKQGQTRGRLANMTSQEDLSRGTSTSTGSSTGKRNTLSAEECQQLKRKGKQIFERDNTSYTQDKERERREREAIARVAREQAAERSRAASREWAEKKRRKDLAMRDAMKQGTYQAV